MDSELTTVNAENQINLDFKQLKMDIPSMSEIQTSKIWIFR